MMHAHIIVGIVKGFLVERYWFKRRSEAGYVQSQTWIHSKIHAREQASLIIGLLQILKVISIVYLWREYYSDVLISTPESSLLNLNESSHERKEKSSSWRNTRKSPAIVDIGNSLI